VEAEEVLPLLIDDRVDRGRGLSGLPVADDQLALTTADREHCVDRLHAGLHRGIDVLALDHAGGDDVDLAALLGLDRTLAVERDAERVHHAPHERVADRHLDDASGGLDLVVFLDLGVVAQDDRRDGVLFEVEGQPEHVVAEVEKLGSQTAGETVDPGDAVADLHDGADVRGNDRRLVAPELLLDDLRDVGRSDAHVLISFYVPCAMTARSVASRVRTEPSTWWSPIRTTSPPPRAGSSARVARRRFPVSRSRRATMSRFSASPIGTAVVMTAFSMPAR